MNYDLSILIPARNEMFLKQTVDNLLENIEGDTEIIVVLDGEWANPPIPQHPRVTILYNPVSVGQRAATNQAARLSQAKYVMKIDAHCVVDKGFDVKLMADMQDDWTVVPTMYNLHAFDWVCTECKHRIYQGPTPEKCPKCAGKMEREIIWKAKPSPTSTAYRFDKTLHFQYHNERKKSASYQYGLIRGYVLSFDRTAPSGIVEFLANFARTHGLVCLPDNSWWRQHMTSNTMRLSSIDDSRSVGINEVLLVGDESQMQGVTTASIFTKMINNRDMLPPSFREILHKPSIEDSMYQCFLAETGIATISAFVDSANPIPATGSTINSDLVNQLNDVFGGQFVYSENSSSFHNGSVSLTPIRDKAFNETMSILGACFMLTRDKYWELDICDEGHGSWGQQGVEVACKTWLSGGRLMVNKKTWFAHMFRTQGGDFGFPYPNPGITKAREYSKELWFGNKWPKAKHDLKWLIDKFAPVPDWDISCGILYYSANDLEEGLFKKCQEQIKKGAGSRRIVSVTLKPTDFGDNIHLPLERGYLTMAKQILAGLKELDTDIVFFTEHDVLYHPSHFDFIPPEKDRYYYNTNVWRVRADDGHSLYVDNLQQLSGLCAYRELLLQHYEKRVKLLEEKIVSDPDGFNAYVRAMGFEPGTHNRSERVDDYKAGSWQSQYPNVDIRHGGNLTPSRWSKEQFRNEKYTRGWKEESVFNLPGWTASDLTFVDKG